MGISESFGLPPRRVAILAPPGTKALEIAGPYEIFALVAGKLREAGRERMAGYVVETVSATGDLAIRSPNGPPLLAERSFRDVDYEIDTLLVAGGLEIWTGAEHPELLEWVRQRAKRARRFGSVCTGAFVLAEAGLLTGRRVTTHWYYCDRLQQSYPDVVVDPEPIFIRDGPLFTSAGVTAGLDLAVAMVDEDFGADISMRIARALVLFLRRPGGQNQFSTSLAFQGVARVPMRELPVYILENLRTGLTVEDLAKRVSMSVRNFARVFAQEFGTTPGAFVERLRIDTARRLVEESSRGFEEIAAACGLGTAETMRRAFVRDFGATPAELRRGLDRGE
jgi:hypothetical protein